jgi:hypothetical protein
MIRRTLCLSAVSTAVVVPAVVVFVFPSHMNEWWRRATGQATTPDTRTPAEKRADRHSLQLQMLTKHRGLFEAAARGEPGKAEELRDTVEGLFILNGPPFVFEWRYGTGHFSHAYSLYYCPNGDRDLPSGFWDGRMWYSDPMKIDDHWFAAWEPSG